MTRCTLSELLEEEEEEDKEEEGRVTFKRTLQRFYRNCGECLTMRRILEGNQETLLSMMVRLCSLNSCLFEWSAH